MGVLFTPEAVLGPLVCKPRSNVSAPWVWVVPSDMGYGMEVVYVVRESLTSRNIGRHGWDGLLRSLRADAVHRSLLARARRSLALTKHT